MKLSSPRSLSLLAASLLLCVIGAVTIYLQAARQLEQIELHRVSAQVAQESEALLRLAEIASYQVEAARDSATVRRLAEADNAAERARLAEDFLAAVAARPELQQLRLIRVDEAGREWVRVDRNLPGDPPRVVPEDELQAKGGRDYVRQGRQLPPGETLVTPIELNREGGDYERPIRPVLRAVTPVTRADETVVAVVVANVDVRAALAAMQIDEDGQVPVYVVDAQGQFLLHPEETKRYGLTDVAGWTAPQEFVGWTAWLQQVGQASSGDVIPVHEDADAVAVMLPLIHGVGPHRQTLAYVVARVPTATLQVLSSATQGGVLTFAVVLVVGLLLVAGLLWRAVQRPLEAIIGAVEAHEPDSPLRIPVKRASQFSGLARAIESLAASAAERKMDLEQEVAERRRLHEMMERIVEALPDALLVVDAEGKVSFATARALQLCDRTASAVLGSPSPFVFKIGEVIESSRVPEGSRKLCSLEKRAVPVRWLGEEATLVLVRDVTEQRELVNQLNQAQKMEAVGQLAGGISHDFANLLSIMTMSTEMMQLEGCIESDAGRELLRDLRTAVRRASGLTKRLLAFSHKSDDDPEPLNLSDVVAEIMKMLRRLLPADVQVTLSMEPELYPVFMDRVQLEQVIVNLVVNARDAMLEGGEVVVATQNITFEESYQDSTSRIPAGEYAVVAVTDNGSGMTAEVRERIFEPFFTTKGAGSGTGLGLANVYGIVQRAGGVIAVYSEVDVGTTFRCYLPRYHLDLASLTEVAQTESLVCGTGRILLVEDDPHIRALVARSLEQAGYEIESTANGCEAIERLERNSVGFDLVVTDMMMPKVGGMALRTFVAKHYPETKVLLTSGFGGAFAEDGDHGFENVPFLAKPFSPLVLTRKVKEVLR